MMRVRLWLEGQWKLPLFLTSLFFGSGEVWAIATEVPVTINAGQGMIGFASLDPERPLSQLHSTHWVEAQVQPFRADSGWRPVSFQLGTHQSEEVTKGVLCEAAPSIAGRTYCSTSESELRNGPRFMAFYGGVQADLIEMATGEARPLRLFVGEGLSQLQSVSIAPVLLPYTSFAVLYKNRGRISARAGVYVSPVDRSDALGLAVPSFSLSYSF